MSGFLAQHAILWPVLLPLLTAAVSATLWNAPRAQRLVAAAGVALTLAAALLLLSRAGDGTVLVARFGSWDAPFGIVFVADRLAAMMVGVAALVSACVFLFGTAEIRRRQQRAGFHPLYQGMIFGINGAFLTGDIFNLYVWFEVMLITSMGLLVIDRTRAQLDGAMKYAALNLFATLLFLIAVGILYGSTGTLNMADLARVLPQIGPSPSLTIAALMLLCGFGIKAGYFPLFFWLPASYHTASATVAAIFAGLLTKVGVYTCLRVYTLVFPAGENGVGTILLVLSAATMLFGVLGAIAHTDIRRILAYQIVSQIGYMLVGLALSTPEGLASAGFYILHDILVKANLFLLAGAICRAAGTFDLAKAGGLAARAPLLAVLFAVPALSLVGMPPFSGFWAKFLVIDAALRGGLVLVTAVALLAALVNFLSMARLWSQAFWKPAAMPRAEARPVPLPMLAASAVLGAATLAIGLAPNAVVLYAQGVAGDLLDPAAYLDAVLPGGAR